MEQTQNTKPEEKHELANHHQKIFDQYRDLKPEMIQKKKDIDSLIAYNGYYSLNTAPGAFFAIDTSIYFNSNLSSPYYIVNLLIALDGKTPYSIEFTGTFDSSQLIQNSEGINIDLTFVRTNGADGTTASCSGKIGVNHLPQINVSGSTYNNPIPNSLFEGTYYLLQPLHLSPDKEDHVFTKVMEISNSNSISYDFGSGDGVLKPVKSYVYNMNMYYFSFDSNQDSLIMGTAAAAGFACNNMTVTNGVITSRSLQTIVNPDIEKKKQIPNLNSYELADFSGYYQLPSISPLAFLSVQAEYIVIDAIPIYSIAISISLDGVTSKGYYFDWDKMSFNKNTLVMTEQQINLKFDRIYNASNRSLVKVTGTIDSYNNIEAYTLFNPVPLSAFGGVPLTNSNGDSLTIVDYGKVIYNSTEMTNFIYVPLMYILANTWDNTTTVLSLGTSGTKGTACIVIDVVENKTSFVYAIPNP